MYYSMTRLTKQQLLMFFVDIAAPTNKGVYDVTTCLQINMRELFSHLAKISRCPNAKSTDN